MIGATDEQDSLTRYVEALRALWGDGKDEQLPYKAQGLLEELLISTSPFEPWIASLIAGSRPAKQLYRDTEKAFVQVGYIHEKGYRTSPHDHGPCWVLHGVYHGATEITTYTRLTARAPSGRFFLQPKETRRLTQGIAVLYLPGEIHSMFVPEPSVILTLFSQDPRTVERNHYHFDGIGFRLQQIEPAT